MFSNFLIFRPAAHSSHSASFSAPPCQRGPFMFSKFFWPSFPSCKSSCVGRCNIRFVSQLFLDWLINHWDTDNVVSQAGKPLPFYPPCFPARPIFWPLDLSLSRAVHSWGSTEVHPYVLTNSLSVSQSLNLSQSPSPPPLLYLYLPHSDLF